ncbi:hypothetical protein AC1031_020411 [Aphanomyces cochlioides]|nr:hypothetical protein AC1031_020411 [Aphanomyces cochlioides]
MRDSRITWPNQRTQTQWAEKSNNKEPLVYGVFAFLDGKNLRVQSPSRTDLQNALYNGKVYQQFQLPLPFDPDLRAVRIDNIFRLYNFRVRRTGISEIKNVFGV